MTKQEIEAIFKPFSEGRIDEFFEHVADDVEWHVLGTHPIAGVYYSKDELRAATFGRLGKLFDHALAYHVRDVLVEGDRAVVELYSKEVSRAGVRFDNESCWVCEFKNGKIAQLRAYLDSALMQELIDVGEFRVRKHHHPGARELGKPAPRGVGHS